jgi:hypothetical protein
MAVGCSACSCAVRMSEKASSQVGSGQAGGQDAPCAKFEVCLLPSRCVWLAFFSTPPSVLKSSNHPRLALGAPVSLFPGSWSRLPHIRTTLFSICDTQCTGMASDEASSHYLLATTSLNPIFYPVASALGKAGKHFSQLVLCQVKLKVEGQGSRAAGSRKGSEPEGLELLN